MQLIYTIPLFLLFILILALCLMVSLAGVCLVRRCDWMLDPEDNSTTELAHAFVGVLYAVALSLMVVGVQSDYTETVRVLLIRYFRLLCAGKLSNKLGVKSIPVS